MKKVRSVIVGFVALGAVAFACGDYSSSDPGGQAGSTGVGGSGTGGTGVPSACGNGVVDSGETCDPQSSCPSSCDDGQACTVDTTTGSAATCDIVCEHSTIDTCVAGDGCCPSGCDATSDSDCSATCGNGTLDAGETCDPPESCDSTCNDGNACTTDELTGSAANCNLACSHNSITSCASGDGCCPTGCDATSDDDCSGTCGDSVVDPGETCDPPGSCPTACDDGNACTIDQKTGSADNCNVACSNTAITACASGDGCCAPGCDAATDDDCSLECGNGTVDAGETCDPPDSCPADCDDGNACTIDQKTGSAANCNVACSNNPITTCASDDGCCPPGCDSTADNDCSLECGNGVVEAEETCDPPAVECPTECDDGNACTRDQLTGSAANCNAACSNTDITACSSDDGCCPATCTSANDNDCGPQLPCDLMEAAGQPCVAAHSTVRRLYSGYTGPLYQLCKGTATPGPNSCKGESQDIGAVDGYGDKTAHDAFCAGSPDCTISFIYDQSGMGNDMEPAPGGGADRSPDPPARANDLPITINGHEVYGIRIRAGMGYRTGCNDCTIKKGIGTAVGDEPETQYWITSSNQLEDGCCFDYGNCETTQNDDGNGTMETLYFGGGVVWGTGEGGKPGPWMMADLENGLYAGWENRQDRNISTNHPLHHDFVVGVLVGDTADKNGNKGRFAIYAGDAQAGELQTMYDGIRPEKPGYVPMDKQGSIELGIGGDNSSWGAGHFYEGFMVNGASTKETVDALQESVVASKYGQ